MLKKFAFFCFLFFVASGAWAQMPFLHADGAAIVDEAGKPVHLGGVNLGGWLVEEMWMEPFETKPPAGSSFGEIKDHVTLWRTVEKRLGAAGMMRARTAFRANWLTEADFDRIENAKLNCVRLPFLYDMLEEPDGWHWLDTALAWAKARKIYVILDLHGAPGRQSADHHTGEAGVNRLFSDAENVKQTAAVWTKIAARYRDHAEVAGYDLLNEPMGALNNATLYVVMDKLYQAVRAADTKHMIIIEDGYKGMQDTPRPAPLGWKNVAYSGHHYNFNAKSEEEQANGAKGQVDYGKNIAKDRQVPYYCGEFQFEPKGTPNTLQTFIQAADAGGVAWTIWTYKTCMAGGDNGMWGWYRNHNKLDPINPFTDSADDIIKKCHQYRTETFYEDRAMTAAFQTHTP